MSRIRSKNTKPELAVRTAAHNLGYRFRLHRRDLPGSPDLVFPRYKKAIFVHGCYWHRHQQCRYAYTPKSNIQFWQSKFSSNIARDSLVSKQLKERGWETLVVWECETSDIRILEDKLIRYLGNH